MVWLSSLGHQSKKKKLSLPSVPVHFPSSLEKRPGTRIDAEKEMKAQADEIAQLKLALAESDEATAEALKDRQKALRRQRGVLGRPQKEDAQVGKRKKPGSAQKRLEVAAATKLRYCKEMKEELPQFSNLKDFWKAQMRKYGLQKAHLQNILSREDHWQKLVAEPKLKAVKKDLRKTQRKRAQGAGRQHTFPQMIRDMKQWRGVERSCGHTITKQDLVIEYQARLQLFANKKKAQAESAATSALAAAELKLAAEEAEKRKKNIAEKAEYKKWTSRVHQQTGEMVDGHRMWS